MPYYPQNPIAIGRPKTGSTFGFVIPGVEAISSGTVTLSINQLRYEQFFVTTPITIDQLVTEITAGGAGATTYRIGIYNADTDWQPTSLVLDAGTQAADVIAVKTLTLSTPLTLAPGRYLFAMNTDGTPTMRCVRGGSMLGGLTAAFGVSPFVVSLVNTQAYAAFPSVGLAWSTLNTAGGSPQQHCVLCRVSVP